LVTRNSPDCQGASSQQLCHGAKICGMRAARLAGSSSGVSICTCVLVKQVNCVPSLQLGVLPLLAPYSPTAVVRLPREPASQNTDAGTEAWSFLRPQQGAACRSYVSMRTHTSAYVSIRHHTSTYLHVVHSKPMCLHTVNRRHCLHRLVKNIEQRLKNCGCGLVSEGSKELCQPQGKRRTGFTKRKRL
jgi:hypothetical protein